MDLAYARRGAADRGSGQSAPPRVSTTNGELAVEHTPASVFVLDEDEGARMRVGEILASVGVRVQGFTNPIQLLDQVGVDRAGCLVLDTRFGSVSGLELQQHLNAEGIKIPLVFLSGDVDIPTAVKAIKMGAVDVLSKPVHASALIDAVSMAFVQDHARRCEEFRMSDMRQRYETLTPREREVMMLVTAGKANKRVAADLGISEITVKMHRGRVTQKMCVRSVADLVKAAALLERPLDNVAFGARAAEPLGGWGLRSA